MLTIYLKHLWHRHADCIGIYFTNDSLVNTTVRKLPSIKWSKTFQCWWLLLSKENYQLIKSSLSKIAIIDSSDLKIFLEKRNAIKGSNMAKREVVTAAAKMPLPAPKAASPAP